MKLSEFIKNLQEFEKENGNLDVITSIDDEGNGFNRVAYSPSLGFYNEDEKDFIEQNSEDFTKLLKINTICVN